MMSGLLMMTFVSSAAAMPGQRLSGDWLGSWQDGSGEVRLGIGDQGSGFSISLDSTLVNFPQRQFELHDSSVAQGSSVFEEIVASGMADWLSFGKGPGPLEGKPFSWARSSSEDELTAYRFQLAPDGGFELQRLDMTARGQTLDLQLSFIGADGNIAQSNATLERQ